MLPQGDYLQRRDHVGGSGIIILKQRVSNCYNNYNYINTNSHYKGRFIVCNAVEIMAKNNLQKFSDVQSGPSGSSYQF